MAECCSRCSQERRYYRKELQRWGKNVLLLVGMERAAQEIMGNRKWRKLMTPFNSLELREPEDWSPSETCYFCNTKTLSSNDSTNVVRNPDLEDSLNAPVEHCSLCNGVNSDTIVCTCKSHASPLSCDQPLDLSVHSRHKFAETPHSDDASDLGDNDHSLIKVPQPSSTAKTNKRNRLPTNSVWKRTYTEEELQAALRDIQSGKLGTRRAAVIYGIPRSTLRNKVYKLALDRSNGKRKINNNSVTNTNTRTLTTIKSKAQRSLYSDEKNVTFGRGSADALRQTLAEANSTLNHVNSNSASESLKQLLKNAITQRVNNNNNNNNNTNSISNSEKSLLSVDSASTPSSSFNLTEMYNHEALNTIQMLSTIECGNALAPLFTQFLLNIHQLALATNHQGDSYGDLSTLMAQCIGSANLPIMPELIRKLAEDRLLEEKSNNDQHSTNRDTTVDDGGNSNVILKVPSFKPKTMNSTQTSSDESKQQQHQLSVMSNNSDNEQVIDKCTTSISSHSQESDDIESKSFSLKEIIAKSISQRLTTSCAKSSSGTVANSEDESCDALNNDDKYNANYSGSGDGKNSGNVSDQSNPSTPEKRNRPKRGRYRNYNRDDLAKAVRAVQRGEMSVHRAGTLFGVPHSTLEYKVKERHLLRPKKRHHDSSVTNNKKESVPKTNAGTRSHNGTSSVTASNTNANNNAVNSAVNNVHLPFWQAAAFPFFSLDMGSSSNSANFFASNMMRRLQENARIQEESSQTQSDTSKEYGGLLLESLIKSSLDSTLSSPTKSKMNKDNDDDVMLNTSLAVLQEVSALDMDKKQ